MQLVFTCTVYRGRTTRHSRPQLVLARRAHHTPLSRSVSFCMQLLFCMHRGHTTRHSRAQLVHACSCFFACTAGTPHATLALSWFMQAQGAHHTPLSRSVGSCMQLPFCMHGGHTTRHSRAQLVHACSCFFACTVGTPHATHTLSWFMHAVGFCMHGGHTTRHSALSWFMHAVASLHAQGAHHTPLSRSVGSCMQLVFACTAGTPHSTLALSWFLHARRAHHTPLSRSVGFCMHGGHTTRHPRAELVLTSMHGGQYTRHSRAQLVLACSCLFACTGGTPHATLALSWFLHARWAHHTPLSRSVGSN